jgi:hypothetical protein
VTDIDAVRRALALVTEVVHVRRLAQTQPIDPQDGPGTDAARALLERHLGKVEIVREMLGITLVPTEETTITDVVRAAADALRAFADLTALLIDQWGAATGDDSLEILRRVALTIETEGGDAFR